MTAARKAIRAAFKTRLATPDDHGVYPTPAEDRVYTSRIAPITDDDLPAIMIYAREEKGYSTAVDGEDGWMKRELHLVVDSMVKGGESVDDALDDMAEVVESLLTDWEIPGFESANIVLHESDIDLVTEGVRRPIGTIGLTFVVTYRTPWRVRPPGTRPDSVWAIINGHDPEQIIDHDKGPANKPLIP
jgi:hypothetical protein